MPRACWGSQSRSGRFQSRSSSFTLQFRWRGALGVGCQVKGTTSFAIDGTTWLAGLPVMGPPGVASGLSGCSAAVLADELPGDGDASTYGLAEFSSKWRTR